MPITPPPPTPSRTNPLTFSPRMDAFLAWFPTFVTDYNNDAALMGRRYVTYGGTANAITLTGALPAGASSIPVGTQVRFRATATNTGAATINLDGTGAIACRTVIGFALPAGYVRTDADTTAVFDGTYWVLDREAERGANANGGWVRYADGRQECTTVGADNSGINSASGNVFRSPSDITWTYPAAFVAAPVMGFINPSVAGLAIRSDRVTGLAVSGRGLTSLTFRLWASTTFAAGTDVNYTISAAGHWY